MYSNLYSQHSASFRPSELWDQSSKSKRQRIWNSPKVLDVTKELINGTLVAKTVFTQQKEAAPVSKGKLLDRKRKVKLQRFPKAKHLQIRTKRWKIILYLPNCYQHYQSNAIQFSDILSLAMLKSVLISRNLRIEVRVDFLAGLCCCRVKWTSQLDHATAAKHTQMSGWGSVFLRQRPLGSKDLLA